MSETCGNCGREEASPPYLERLRDEFAIAIAAQLIALVPHVGAVNYAEAMESAYHAADTALAARGRK